MQQTLESSSSSKNLPWHDILDSVSLIGVIGSSVASVVSQQVAFAAIPLSLSVALNLVNRRQLLKTMDRNHQAAIASLTQLIEENQTAIAASLTEQMRESQINLETLSGQLKGVQQQFTSDLSASAQELHDNIHRLEASHKQLKEVVGDLRDIENFSQAIRTNPNSAQFYYERGLRHQRLGDKQGAIEDYTEAIQLDSSYAKAYHNRGILNADLNKRKRAVEDLRRAAKFYFEQGDIDSYQKARDLSREFYDLNFLAKDEKNEAETKNNVSEKLVVGGLFS